MTVLEKFQDQLLMADMGSKGHTRGHHFLQDCHYRHPESVDGAKMMARSRDRGVRFFVPPKKEDRVALFTDGSGVYIHKDGLCTIMGSDIREEVNRALIGGRMTEDSQ